MEGQRCGSAGRLGVIGRALAGGAVVRSRAAAVARRRAARPAVGRTRRVSCPEPVSELRVSAMKSRILVLNLFLAITCAAWLVLVQVSGAGSGRWAFAALALFGLLDMLIVAFLWSQGLRAATLGSVAGCSRCSFEAAFGAIGYSRPTR